MEIEAVTEMDICSLQAEYTSPYIIYSFFLVGGGGGDYFFLYSSVALMMPLLVKIRHFKLLLLRCLLLVEMTSQYIMIHRASIAHV